MSSTDRERPDLAGDVLLAALADARQRKEQADRDMRLLLAYAREIAGPRPYRLADLAEAAGMSVSGVRTAYTTSDVEHVIRLLNGSARIWQRLMGTAVTALTAPPAEYTASPGPISGRSRAPGQKKP